MAARACEEDDDERPGIATFPDGLDGGGNDTDFTEDITSAQTRHKSCNGMLAKCQTTHIISVSGHCGGILPKPDLCNGCCRHARKEQPQHINKNAIGWKTNNENVFHTPGYPNTNGQLT